MTVEFSDGGMTTGSLVFDADTDGFSTMISTISGGGTPTFPGYNYAFVIGSNTGFSMATVPALGDLAGQWAASFTLDFNSTCPRGCVAIRFCPIGAGRIQTQENGNSK